MINTSSALNKHFANKRITDRNDKGHISSVNALLRWCLKYTYDIDCKLFRVVDPKGFYEEFKSLDALCDYLRSSQARKDNVRMSDGSLNIRFFRALYHSKKVKDRSKDVELIMYGAEEYGTDPLNIKKPKAKLTIVPETEEVVEEVVVEVVKPKAKTKAKAKAKGKKSPATPKKAPKTPKAVTKNKAKAKAKKTKKTKAKK